MRIQIDGKDLDPCDPLSDLVEMVLLIQERKLYGRLEIALKDGQIVSVPIIIDLELK